MPGLEVEQVDRIRLRRRISRPVEASPCACTPDRMCLFHYGQLDPPARARARCDVGIAAFEGRRF